MKKFILKILLDIILTVGMIALMDTAFTGMMLHELAGIGIFILFIVHNLLNLKWIKNVATKLFSKKTKGTVKLMILLNLLMFLDFTTVIISGIGMSQELFNLWETNSDVASWIAVHNSASYFGLILIAVHLGLHWGMIMAAMRKAFKLKPENRLRTILARIAAVIMMIFGVRGMVNQNILYAIGEPFRQNNSNADKKNTSNTKSSQITAEQAELLRNTIGGNAAVTETVEVGETLDDYLSRLVCTGCGKRCPLTSPRCGTGRQQAQSATTYYNSNSSSSAETITTVDNDDNEQAPAETTINTTENTDSANSLEDYLSKLVCTGCNKRCPLSAPQCMKGQQQAQTATQDYYDSVSTSESESESNTENTDSTDNSEETVAEQAETTITTQETEITTSQTETAVITELEEVADGETLDDYLSRQICTGCSKHCSLLAPLCMTGEQIAQDAQNLYLSETNSDTTDTSNENSMVSDIFDYTAVIALFVGGTHYLLYIPKLFSKIKTKK